MVVPAACGWFLPPEGPVVPEENQAVYPDKLYVSTFGCSGDKSVPRLKVAARKALIGQIRSAVSGAFGEFEKTLKKLGLPARYASWPRYLGDDSSIPYEHLVKTDLNTHWRDEYEGSCVLAALEREKASWILQRDYKRHRKQFEFSAESVLARPDEPGALSSHWEGARTAFGDMAHVHFHRSLVEHGHDLRSDEWQALEGRYVELVFAVEEMLSSTPVLIHIGGTAPAGDREAVSVAAEEALETLGVRLRKEAGGTDGFALEIEMRFNCRQVGGAECCVRLAGQLLPGGGDSPVAECDLSPADPCASAGASQSKSKEVLIERMTEGVDLPRKLAACVGLVLPVE